MSGEVVRNLQTRARCACGSGLSASRCCRLDAANLGNPDASRHLVPIEERALEAHRSGAKEEAERLAIDVLELAPGRTRALGILYEIRKAENVAEAILALIRRFVAIEPNNFWATNEITLLLLARGDSVEALRHARNAIRIAPQNAQSHYLMGMTLTEVQRPAHGEYHYIRALELSGSREPVVLSNMALCLKNQGKMAAARALYAEAITAAPTNVHALMGFARLDEADRDLTAASALLDKVETLQPENQHALLLRATVMGRQGETAGALDRLDKLATSRPDLSPSELIEKGRLLDRMKRYEEAFAAYEAGKKRLREISGKQYLDAQVEQHLARLKGFFTANRLTTLPRASLRTDVAQPVFVMGFPRSGTTLVEQILSSHPRISAGDELPFIAEITNLMPRLLESPLQYPEALAELWMADHREDLDNLRDFYLRRVAQLGIVAPGSAWFTDKMPLNETDMGLISLVFPHSPLLHVTRHPLDVVLSVFSNLLTHGSFCAYSLETAALHYVRVMDLVDHYTTELSLRYRRVRYEDIVDHIEPSVRSVLEFIGEPYDPACLAFHENRRYARTASYAQVAERLYDRSRYRYRNYLPQLQPVIPLLQPTIERLGYTI